MADLCFHGGRGVRAGQPSYLWHWISWRRRATAQACLSRSLRKNPRCLWKTTLLQPPVSAHAAPTDPLSYLTDQLNDLKAKGLYFHLRVLDDEQAPECTFDGKHVINLASNNYLGLPTHPKLREAALDATRKYGVGSGAVRTIAGTMKIHMELEEKIARFKNSEACVVFQSGFAANAGTVSAVLGKEDFIISDQLNHASIIDGARLSRAKILVFEHRNIADAE